MRLAAIAVLVCSLTVIGPHCSAQSNPEQTLQELNRWFSQRLNEVRSSGGDAAAINALMKERVDKAKGALQGVDLANQPPATCLAWAQLCQIAQQPGQVIVAAQRFLQSEPEEGRKQAALSLLLGAYQATRDADGILKTLDQVRPANTLAARSLVGMIARGYAGIVAEKKGPDAALTLLERAERMLPADAPSDDRERQVHGSAVAAVAEARADILTKVGKKAEALAVLEAAIAKLGDNQAARGIAAKLAHARLPGSPAPEIKMERGYGNFPGLEKLRGKVVVLDFMAHWCPPCKASYPATKEMYKEWKDRGLEIVGITTYYGYYGQERNLSPDQEFAKLQDHINEFGVPWPLIVGDRSNFTAYGVSGIPQYVVIDREGKVKSITVGYSPALHEELRKSVEEALGK